jgi:hypothetical protein
MTTESSPSKPLHNAPAGPLTQQQKIVARITAQRERVRARRSAYKQSKALQAGQTETTQDDSLVLKAVAFAKQHPAALVALVGAGLALGPSRVMRWATIALPWVLKMRR